MTDAKSAKRDPDVGADPNSPFIQIVRFELGSEVYGIEITKTQEVVLMEPITELPNTPPHIRGLINLRSKVIPVMDLRRRLGMPPREPDDQTRMIVVDLDGKKAGLIVDTVNEVMRFSSNEITPPPATLASIQRSFISGLIRQGSRVLILLDVAELFEEADFEGERELESIHA